MGVPSLADMSVPEWDHPGLLLYTRCVPKSEVIRPSSGQMKGPEKLLDGVVFWNVFPIKRFSVLRLEVS